MKKRTLKCVLAICAVSMLAGCGAKTETADTQPEAEVTAEVTPEAEVDIEEPPVEVETEKECPLEDGTYVAEFNTDSSMFHVNEANNGKGILTVKDGVMTMHVSLTSKNILNLYPGMAEDAEKDGAVLLEPTVDTVTYEDGMSDEVHGFDIPVPAIEEEFDLALIGSKGKWYDHKVSVNNPVPGDDLHAESSLEATNDTETTLEEGEYLVDIAMEGGSGKAKIESPAKMVVKDGVSVVTITWSSPNYDYMILDGEKYLPVNTEGNSVFELPISEFGTPVTVIGDTTAMSKPHEVEYTITCTVQ